MCLLCKIILKVSYLIIILWTTLEKGECFDFNYTLGCVYRTLYIFRLLGQVCHLSLLICCPCSFYIHVLMLAAFWEWKLPPFNDNGKHWKLTTDFDKILTFSLARGCNFVLSLGVTTLLITPVMGMSCPCNVSKDCFDMLKSILFVELVGRFSSLRQSDRVYLGWFLWYLVWRLFKMQALKRSVKAH